jgi:quinol monooxygenase YgiN
MPITRINAFQAKPGLGAALRAFLTSVVTDVRAAPGCRSCQLYEALDDPERFAVVEVWDTVAAHKEAGRALAPPRLEEAMRLLGSPAIGTYYRSVGGADLAG